MNTFILTMLFLTLVPGQSANAPTMVAVTYANQVSCEAAKSAFYQNVGNDQNFARIAWCSPYDTSASQLINGGAGSVTNPTQ